MTQLSTFEIHSKRRLKKRRPLIYLTVLGLTFLAALLRFPWLDRLPPGLYHDEAYNGLDALAINEGRRAIFFEANNGREPLHIYLMSITVRFFGRTPVGVRAAAAFLGVLLIPLIFLLGKEMFDERVGLWAALMAVSNIWLLCLSRTGFRAGSLTVVSAAGLAALWRGRNTGQRRWFALAGALLGLTQYTYTAARFVPVALVLGLLLTWRHWRGLGRHLFLLAICILLVDLPLAIYALAHLDLFLARPRQLLILDPRLHQGQLLKVLAEQAIAHAKAVFLEGDSLPRHNVPGKPMLAPLTALLCVIGLVKGATSRISPRLSFASSWIVIMFLPSYLAWGGNSFLRLSGLPPMLLLLPALGADWLWRQLLKWKGATASLLLLAATAATGVHNVMTYYLYYAQSQSAFYSYEVPSTEIASYINCFLEHGYVRDDLPLLPAPSGLPRSVCVARDLLHFSETVVFLLQPDPRVHRLAQAPPAAKDEERMLMVVPGSSTSYLQLLPPRRQIQVYLGSKMRDQQRAGPVFQPHTVFVATRPPDLDPVARFEDGISLLDYRLARPDPETLAVRLRWQADRNPEGYYILFVHLLQGGTLISQHDGPPAHDYYPTTHWREGDVVVDVHRLTIPAGFDIARGMLRVGVYRPENLVRLQCILADGSTQDSVLLPVSDGW